MHKIEFLLIKTKKMKELIINIGCLFMGLIIGAKLTEMAIEDSIKIIKKGDKDSKEYILSSKFLKSVTKK
jgi:hypothetical protein